jgi:glutathione S-transferase
MPPILYNGPTSPFGRTVTVTKLELGLMIEERAIDLATAEFIDKVNPLRQIPTLQLEDGSGLYDSRIICRYFDSIAGKPTLYPKADAWGVETRIALGTGIMEAGLLRRMEIIRPAGEQSPGFVKKLEARIDRSIDHLEGLVGKLSGPALRMDQIVVACALGYTDFRYNDGWRKRNPALDRWERGFAARPHMQATKPA